ncbi:MAG: sugar ABC transporter ATP-binding protein [Verrucomicrobiota bacterium]
MSNTLAVNAQGVCKSYTPGVPVLQSFDFQLAPGEVHALIGSNGAGKSTFAKILTGLTPFNGGSIQLHDKLFAPRNKQEATTAGVVMVLQELNIIPTLSVAENLFLHQLPKKVGLLDKNALRLKAKEALARMGLEKLDPSLPGGMLGVGQQQLVEIATALAQESSVLILDEPTAALTSPEIDLLFERIRLLKQEGVAVIYISHRMDEIERIADAVTVMRDGERAGQHRIGEVTIPALIREMAGHEVKDSTDRRSLPESKEVTLSVSDLRREGVLRGISFEAHRGEILGLAGLIGAGRTETLRAIFGADRVDGGRVTTPKNPSGLPFSSPQSAVWAGLAFVPEDRKAEGLLLDRSVGSNTTLATLSQFAAAGLVQTKQEEDAAVRVCERLAVKCESLAQAVRNLSGGNQQKIIIGRWLLTECDIFLFDEPTRGIDVAAKDAVYDLLDELAAAGKTIVVVSSDLEELMRISHRIVVLSNGSVTGEFEPESWTSEAITAASFAGFGAEKEVAA